MNKLSVVYATKTNHSKKLGTAIAKALNIKAYNLKENPILEEVDLLFIVGGIYGGAALPELLKFAQDLDEERIKKVALITSSASQKHGQKEIRKILEEKNIQVVDELLSQGSFLIMKIGHPNSQDVKEAVDFAIRLSKEVIV